MTSLTISVLLAARRSEQLTPQPCLEPRGEGLSGQEFACAHTPGKSVSGPPLGPPAHTMERVIPFEG